LESSMVTGGCKEVLPWGGARGRDATPWSECAVEGWANRPSSDTAEPFMFLGRRSGGAGPPVAMECESR